MSNQALHPIQTLEDIRTYLYHAMQLEHATIPVYLTALYSIHPEFNSDAAQILRVVAVEEMLHLTLAANMLNAVGGKVDLTQSGFVPDFPTYLPDGETDFEVNLSGFSRETLDLFLKIERPASTKADERLQSGRGFINRPENRITMLPTVKSDESNESDDLHFYSIGEFYAAISVGLEQLCAEMGEEKVFCGERTHQITPEYYYSGGGELIPVYDLKSAKAAIRLISEQGEGFEGGILDFENEISHYYRFQQLELGRYYLASDAAGNPTGHAIEVNWDAAYPVKPNVKLADLPQGEIYDAATSFNKAYKDFLTNLTTAFNGKPDQFFSAVGEMFCIKNQAIELIRNPIPGCQIPDSQRLYHAAPTFEVDRVDLKQKQETHHASLLT